MDIASPEKNSNIKYPVTVTAPGQSCLKTGNVLFYTKFFLSVFILYSSRILLDGSYCSPMLCISEEKDGNVDVSGFLTLLEAAGVFRVLLTAEGLDLPAASNWKKVPVEPTSTSQATLRFL